MVDKRLILNSIRSHLGFKTNKQFAEFLGIKPTTLAMWFKRNTFDIELIFNKCESLNSEWLLTGKGEMLKPSTNKLAEDDLPFTYADHPESTAVPLDNMMLMRVPIVTQYAYAGYLSGYSDPEYIEELPYIYIMVDREYKGRYQGFQVRGDSMYDGTDESIQEGVIAVGRNVAQHHWQSKLHIRRWNFVIVHKEEGILVKKLIDHNVEQGTITAHSLNSYYEDRVFHLDEIAELWNVVKIVKDM